MRPNSNNYRQYRKNAAGNPILPDGEPLFRVGIEGFKDTIYGLI